MNGYINHKKSAAAGVAFVGISLILSACGASTGATGSKPDEIVIGSTVMLTGALASYGESMKNGQQLAINEINDAGGINGVKVRGEYLDSQANPGVSVGLTRQLLADDNVLAITNCVPAVALAQQPLTSREHVALFGPCLNENEQLNLEGFLNLTPTTDQERVAMLKYIHDEEGVQNLSILVESVTSEKSHQILENTWKELTGEDLNLVVIETGTNDASPQITKLLSNDPEAIYILTDGTLGQTVIKNMQSMGVDLPMYGNIATEGYLDTIREAKLDWTWTTGVTEYSDDFMAAFDKAHPGETPSLWDGTFYSSVMVVKQALEYADEKGYGMTREGLYKALEEKRDYEGCCGPITFTDANGVEGNFAIKNTTSGAEPTEVTTVPAT